jgi:F-type H+-transporting ATPase subunit epsilon
VPLQVELVSADSRVWSGEASMLVARTTEGEIGILTGHSPLLAVLAPGEVRIDAGEGGTVVADVSGGFLSVEHDRVTVVSDAAALTSGSRSA